MNEIMRNKSKSVLRSMRIIRYLTVDKLVVILHGKTPNNLWAYSSTHFQGTIKT